MNLNLNLNLRFLKNFVLTVLPSALLLMAIPMSHASAESMGYVDPRRLIEQSPQGKDESEKLEAAFAKRNQELKGQFDTFKAQEEELEKNGVLMTAAELQSKGNDLRELQRQLRRAQREYNEDYTLRRSQGLSKLEKIITEAVIAVAKRKKLDVVLQQVVYVNPDVDLTEQVLAELKKRHRK